MLYWQRNRTEIIKMKDSIALISRIKSLQKRRSILNCFRILPPFAYFTDILDKKKMFLVDSIINDVVKSAGLDEKYRIIDKNSLKKIGNRIWVFWYSGYDDAPELVRKCIEIDKSLEEADVIVIDKNNLEEYFTFDKTVRELFESGKISIQAFSDILRCQLMAKYGGFWLDATIFITNNKFVSDHKNMTYFSFRHSRNDLLLKQKWNEFFTEGRWTMNALASGADNPLFSFISDFYTAYFQEHDEVFDYFHLAYIWLYAYENFAWVKEMIDAVEPSVSCSYWLGQHLLKPFKQEEWDRIISENEFQKLNWRKVPPQKPGKKQTYLEFFLENEELCK